jgi:hypothetical protein
MSTLKPVDTAIVVSVGPVIGTGDYVSWDETIAYNESGMSIDLFKESAAGITKVDITPTSGGNYDWTHKGNGVYELEIPASDNDTEGTLWVVGVCDGVLAFESPRYEIVPTAVYNSLVTGSDKLQVDAVEISSDSAAADALELLVENAKGTDHKVLVSTDAQDLSGSLDVNAKTLTDGAITVAKIADNAITAAKLAANAITAAKIATDAITAAGIASDAIGANEFAQAAADKVWSTAVRALTAGVNATSIAGIAAAATKLAASAGTIVTGAATAGTLSVTQMTTDLTEATDDHYIGRVVIWTSGNLVDQATPITDYDGGTKMLTYDTVTEAPQVGDTFVIV